MNDRTDIAKAKESVRLQLDATIKAAGVGTQIGASRNKESELDTRQAQRSESTRARTETQGGNGLLSSK